MDNIKVKMPDTMYIDLIDSPVEQAVPVISEGINGLIEATSTQQRGSVKGGTTRSQYVLPVDSTLESLIESQYGVLSIIIGDTEHENFNDITTQEKGEIAIQVNDEIGEANERVFSLLDSTVELQHELIGDEAFYPSASYEGAEMVHRNTPKVYEAGYIRGYSVGEEDGYNKGYAKGKTDEHNDFWNKYLSATRQEDGTIYGNRLFVGPGWRNATFQPPLNSDFTISSRGCGYMFERTGISDLAGIIKSRNITWDTSASASLNYMFANSSNIKYIPKIIASPNCNSMSNTFIECISLISIEELAVHEGVSFAYTFSNCKNLTNIKVSGIIAQSISFVHSTKLSHESLMSIIHALSNKAEGYSTGTLTIGATNIAKLTEDELAIIEAKGWSYQ